MKPKIFIGSSSESSGIADVLQLNLSKHAWASVWSQAFPLSQHTLDTLLQNCNENDFAIFIFSNDDITDLRGQQVKVPRDNVVFEAGLFMGMHGKEQSFIVIPENIPDLHLPSDLYGFTLATYDSDFAKQNPSAALAPATTQILQAIGKSVWFRRKVDIIATASFNPSATYPLKIEFTIKNNHRVPVALETFYFDLSTKLNLHPKASRVDKYKYRTPYLIGRDQNQRDIYQDFCILEPGMSSKAWVPIDPAHQLAEVEGLIQAQQTGKWIFRTIWFDTKVQTCNYIENF